MVRASVSLLALIGGLGLPAVAMAAADPAPGPVVTADTIPTEAEAPTVVVTGNRVRTSVELPGVEMQKILPGISPLKAIETLPGVLYITADPWGYNEQNAQIFIHGFAANQLGYTMDGLPLGDQSYGNYNGLSPQRAVISENVGRVVVATGAGDLATASNSNLGGTVETYSSAPLDRFGIQAGQTLGSYGASRTFVRVDSGIFGNGNSGYISATRQRARAWDFNGIQGGYQVNAKFVHDDHAGKLTLYFDYNDFTQPNEDATVFFRPSAGNTATAAQLYTPYTKPFFYPDFTGYRTGYLNAFGNSPAAEGSNYRNYYSDAQRTDYLGYARYDAHLTSHLTWSTTGYFHHNDGAGVVAGPLGQSITTAQPYLDPNYASLPTNCRFTGNNNGVRPAACTEPILDKHYRGKRAEDGVKQRAAIINAMMGDMTLVLHTNETGGVMSDLNTASERTGQTKWAQKYGRFYTLSVVRWLAYIFDEMTHTAGYAPGLDSLFGHYEFFQTYTVDDDFLLTRKVWPLT